MNEYFKNNVGDLVRYKGISSTSKTSDGNYVVGYFPGWRTKKNGNIVMQICRLYYLVYNINNKFVNDPKPEIKPLF